MELQREDTRRDAMALLAKLRPSMLLVFLVGVPVILLTRWTFFVHQPDFFERTSPSISKTAAYAPASYLFATGMVATAVFLIASWYIARRINGWSIDALTPGPGTSWLSALGGAATVLAPSPAFCWRFWPSSAWRSATKAT